MFVIYLFLTSFRFYKLFGSLIQKKMRERLPLPFVSCRYFIMFSISGSIVSQQKQLTNVSLVLKDSDMDSENLSSLIRLSVSDGQKTDISKYVSFIVI